MSRRNYSSTAQRTTLSAGCSDVATTMTVTAVTGWPASTPYALIIDPDTVNEEIVLVTNRASLTLTVTRAQGGTTGVAHSSGAVVQHGVYSQDFEDPNAFLNNAAAAPGPVQFSAGAVGAPAITTSGDSNTGIYFSTADNVNVAAGGTLRGTFNSFGFTSGGNLSVGSGAVIIAQAGSTSSTALQASGDANTGLYFPSADAVALVSGGNAGLSINSAGLVTGTGTSYGAWTAYTPTIGGTGWALGNGTVSGVYCKIGRTVFFKAKVTWGTTSTFGASAALTVSKPDAGGSTYYDQTFCYYVDFGTASYVGAALATGSTVTLQVPGTNGLLANVTSSAPHTWATSDQVYVAGTYEASA